MFNLLFQLKFVPLTSKKMTIMRKIMDHSSRSTMGRGPSRSRFWVWKFVMPTKSWMHYKIHFVNFLPSCTVEAVEPPWPHFGSPGPGFRVRSKARRLRPDQVNYWEGALQLLFYKLCLKMIDHGSRSTLGPGPSRSRLGIWKWVLHPLKWGCPTTFVL